MQTFKIIFIIAHILVHILAIAAIAGTSFGLHGASLPLEKRQESSAPYELILWYSGRMLIASLILEVLFLIVKLIYF